MVDFEFIMRQKILFLFLTTSWSNMQHCTLSQYHILLKKMKRRFKRVEYKGCAVNKKCSPKLTKLWITIFYTVNKGLFLFCFFKKHIYVSTNWRICVLNRIRIRFVLNVVMLAELKSTVYRLKQLTFSGVHVQPSSKGHPSKVFSLFS